MAGEQNPSGGGPRAPNRKRSSYFQLLNSIASDLDLMLNDLCKSFPYSGSESPHSPGHGQLASRISRETGLLEQYVRGAEDNDASSGDSIDGTTSERSERSASVVTNSSAETFFSLEEEEQGSEGAVAGSEASNSPAPCIMPPQPLHGPAQQQGLGTAPGQVSNGEVGQWKIPVVDRLIWTHPVWYLPNVSRTGAIHLLQHRDEGIFLVRQSSKKDTMALSVRAGTRPAVEHYLIESSPSSQSVHLEGSNRQFTAIPILISNYCQQGTDLPVKLVLPPVIMEASTHQELTSLALLGQDFWTSPISYAKAPTKKSVLHMTISPYGMGVTTPRTPVSMATSTVTTTTTSSISEVSLSQSSTVRVSEFTKRLENLQARLSPTDDDCTKDTRALKERVLNTTTNTSALSTFTQTTTVNGVNSAGPSSAFRRVKPVTTPDTPYYHTRLSGKLSDYEDLWDSPSPQKMPDSYFKPIQNEVFEQSTNHFSHVNPGYDPDSSTERRTWKKPHIPSIDHVEQTYRTKLERVVPPGLKSKNEAVIFTFEVPSANSPLTNCATLQTPYSSPAYYEPADTRVGKHPGVTNSKGAIRINNVLKQGESNQVRPPHRNTDKIPVVSSHYHSPLDSVRVHSHNRSHSLEMLGKSLERPNEDRAQSLPKHIKDLNQRGKSASPQHSVIHEDTPVVRHRPPPLAHMKHSAPVISKSFEENFFQPDNMRTAEEPLTPHMQPFPVHQSPTSDQASFSESSTAEDQLLSTSPELTLKPLRPLTYRNLQRISDYDNVAGLGAPSSRRTAATSSMCTQYCTPWDSNLWDNLLNMPDPNFPTDPVHPDHVDRMSEPDYTSVYAETESGPPRPPSLSSMGSLAPANSFVWHVKPDRDSAAETTPQPLQEEPPEPVPERVVDSPDSEDEGVVDPDPAVSFPNKLMPFLSTPRLISLRRRGSTNPGFKVRDYVSNLASNPSTTFGKTVENFIQCTKEGQENNPHIVVRNVRQFMNGIKNYLVQNGEGELDRLIEKERSKLGPKEFLNIDAIIEGALHKCVVRPLKQHIYSLFIDEYKGNGNLQTMCDNMKFARTKSAQELGIKPGLLPPQGTSMEVVKHFLGKMQKAYSPLKKLENLLGATSSIYNTVEGSRGPGSSQESVSLGADDFLPMFIYMLVQDGLVTAEIEADYMWGLLHPCLLAGEGGYYLTTLSSAVHIIKNIKVTMETSDSQECILPSLGDLQGFMKIIIPDEKNDSIITKTLPVRPNMTTKDVCNMIAHKFRITNPQDYGLYILVMGIEDKLSDTSCPQTMKTGILKAGRECIFAFKRNNAKFVWPVDFLKK